jgi:transposase
MDFLVTAGPVADCTQALAGRGQRNAEAVLADPGEDAEAIVPQIEAPGTRPVIPPQRNRSKPRGYDQTCYKQRPRIEPCFSQLKPLRRFAPRLENNKVNFHSLVALACSVLLLSSLSIRFTPPDRLRRW